MSNTTIGIIGSGLGGLAAACTLAARGHQVEVFEASDWLGGKAAVLEQDGFRFDMGPTILTIPSVLKRIFAEAGEELDDHLDLVRLDPQWRSFFDDGSVLDLFESEADMSEELDRFSPGGRTSAGYRAFLKTAARLDDISQRQIFWRSVGGIGDIVNLKGVFRGSVLKDVLHMGLGRTVAGMVRNKVPDARVAQMLDHFVQYVGSSPEQAPAILCGIAHMQTEQGVWYPIGGTRAVPEALVALGRSLGVTYHTGVSVSQILTRGGRASGIRTGDGDVIELGAVVSNADAVRTHRELLSGAPSRRFEDRRGYEPACSGVVLYLGLDRAYDHLAHHDFVFSRDPHEEFDAIYRRGEPAEDPTVYLAAPAQTEPGVAPEGGEALYALVHTPFLRSHHHWDEMLPRYRQVILDKLKRTAGMEDIEQRIVTEATLTPQDIHDRYRVLNGAIYGLASHGQLHGGFKPANRSPDVGGLYLCGGASHPGPGMPMVMMSGWIAADALDEDRRRGRLAA